MNKIVKATVAAGIAAAALLLTRTPSTRLSLARDGTLTLPAVSAPAVVLESTNLETWQVLAGVTISNGAIRLEMDPPRAFYQVQPLTLDSNGLMLVTLAWDQPPATNIAGVLIGWEASTSSWTRLLGPTNRAAIAGLDPALAWSWWAANSNAAGFSATARLDRVAILRP